MEKYKIILIGILCSCFLQLSAQFFGSPDTMSFKYKLDYNVPESPAFSILDANPNTVMRGNAAQELIVTLTRNYFEGDKIAPGIAADFNPYFIFGGRLKSIEDYRKNGGKRFLANTQLSLATIGAEDNPRDIFVSGGMRFTLFDDKDPLYNNGLITAVGEALREGLTDPPPPPEDSSDTIVEIPDIIVEIPTLKEAYKAAKDEYQNTSGGSMAFGLALSGRAQSAILQKDSLSAHRFQTWLSGQYDLKRRVSLLGMAMYRHHYFDNESDDNEFIGGVAIRSYTDRVLFSTELTYSSLTEKIDFGLNLEVSIPKVIFYLTIGTGTNPMGEESAFRLKPGIKWNLSETKK